MLDRRQLQVAVALAVVSVSTPAAAWRQILGTPGSDVAISVAVDSAGDTVAVGRVDSAFAVLKLERDTGAVLWQQLIDGERAKAVVLDQSDDVFVSGFIAGAPFALVKFDGATGAELWRFEEPLGLSGGLALDANGDAFVIGSLTPAAETFFGIIKIDGASGTELWRQAIDGGFPGGSSAADGANCVAVDLSTGDVIVGGYLDRVGTRDDFTVIKFAGASGAELWRSIVSDGFVLDGVGGVAVDASGDVFAIGAIGRSLTVRKLVGATGDLLWQHQLPLSGGSSVTVVAGGDVIVAGRVAIGPKSFGGGDFFVERLAGASGAQIWATQINGTYALDPFHLGDGASAARVDAAGDVVAVGLLGNRGLSRDFAVIKFDGASGAERWRQLIDGGKDPHDQARSMSADSAFALALDPLGDVVAAGALHNDVEEQFAIVKLSGLSGSAGPVPGRQLILRDHGTVADRFRMVARLDREIETPPAGSSGDPSLHGATVRLSNPATAESVSVTLPPGIGWTPLGDPAGSRGYRYRDPAGSNGPCTSLVARKRSVRVVCSARFGSFPFTLDEAAQNSLSVSVRFGSDTPQCALFGGTVVKDEGTANPGPRGTFKAKRSLAPNGTCPVP